MKKHMNLLIEKRSLLLFTLSNSPPYTFDFFYCTVKYNISRNPPLAIGNVIQINLYLMFLNGIVKKC